MLSKFIVFFVLNQVGIRRIFKFAIFLMKVKFHDIPKYTTSMFINSVDQTNLPMRQIYLTINLHVMKITGYLVDKILKITFNIQFHPTISIFLRIVSNMEFNRTYLIVFHFINKKHEVIFVFQICKMRPLTKIP